MDADIVISRENDADNVDCNVEECYHCWRWPSRLGQSRNANGRADVKVTRKKENRSRLPWTRTTSMSPSCVNGVEITSKNILMANCVVRVGRSFP